jgi:hypothetical protein
LLFHVGVIVSTHCSQVDSGNIKVRSLSLDFVNSVLELASKLYSIDSSASERCCDTDNCPRKTDRILRGAFCIFGV